jgi:hypothetical protein
MRLRTATSNNPDPIPCIGFANVGLAPLVTQSSARPKYGPGSLRERLEFLQCRPDPGNGPCCGGHRFSPSLALIMLSYLPTSVRKVRASALEARSVAKTKPDLSAIPCSAHPGTARGIHVLFECPVDLANTVENFSRRSAGLLTQRWKKGRRGRATRPLYTPQL